MSEVEIHSSKAHGQRARAPRLYYPPFTRSRPRPAGARRARPARALSCLLSLFTRERERESARARLLKENLGDFAPSEVVAPRSDGVARTAKSTRRRSMAGMTCSCSTSHISEVWGGFSPDG